MDVVTDGTINVRSLDGEPTAELLELFGEQAPEGFEYQLTPEEVALRAAVDRHADRMILRLRGLSPVEKLAAVS
jgi:hypothetical protein